MVTKSSLITITIIIFICVSTLFGCSRDVSHTNEVNDEYTDSSNGTVIANIEFQVATEDTETFDDGIMPWIDLAEIEKELQSLKNPDDILFKNDTAYLVIDYPVNIPAKFEVHSANKQGFTRAELVKIVGNTYQTIYSEEEETAKTKTVPLEERKGLINRNETDGKYGIWGHDLSDLALSEIQVVKKADGKIYLYLNIES